MSKWIEIWDEGEADEAYDSMPLFLLRQNDNVALASVQFAILIITFFVQYIRTMCAPRLWALNVCDQHCIWISQPNSSSSFLNRDIQIVLRALQRLTTHRLFYILVVSALRINLLVFGCVFYALRNRFAFVTTCLKFTLTAHLLQSNQCLVSGILSPIVAAQCVWFVIFICESIRSHHIRANRRKKTFNIYFIPLFFCMFVCLFIWLFSPQFPPHHSISVAGMLCVFFDFRLNLKWSQLWKHAHSHCVPPNNNSK